MIVRRIGLYRDTPQDRGIHIEAIGVTSPYRYQSICYDLLTEAQIGALRSGQTIELFWLRREDLLSAIDS